MDVRDIAAATAYGTTANLDGGEDCNKQDIVATFANTVEGDRFLKLKYTEGESRDTAWYVRAANEIIREQPGGAKHCFHTCVDAGTPGARGEAEKLQVGIREEHPWNSLTLCQLHQGNLFCKSIFAIPEYADAYTKLRSAIIWVKKHHWAYGVWRAVGGSQITIFGDTRAVGKNLQTALAIKNKDVLISVFHSEKFNGYIAKNNRKGEAGQQKNASAEVHRTNVADPEVWKVAQEAITVTNPVVQLARMGDSNKPTMGICLEKWRQAGARIEEMPRVAGTPPARAQNLADIHKDRMERALGDLHYAGFALEPTLLDINIFAEEKVMDGFRATLFAMATAHPLGEEAAERAMKELFIYRAKKGVFARPKTITMISQLPSYQFFQQFGAAIPHLQWFAVRILAMSSGAGSPERFYSKLGWIKNHRRNRLGKQRTEKLLWVHLNILLQRQLEDVDQAFEERYVDTLNDSLLSDDLEAVVIDALDEPELGVDLWGLASSPCKCAPLLLLCVCHL